MSSITNQLWRYYDLEFEVEQVIDLGDGVYKIIGEGGETAKIQCKMFPDKVESVYLWNGFEFENPTTTEEEQMYR